MVVGGVAAESQTMEPSTMQDPLAPDDPMKDEMIDEQHCNGEPGRNCIWMKIIFTFRYFLIGS